MRVAFLGLGLIGGSIARALAGASGGVWTATAWTPLGNGPRLAAAAGVIDRVAASPEAAIEGADLIVLAAPPLDCLDLLRQLGGPLRHAIGGEAVITDVASTKGAICDLAAEIGLRFVGGHPMAGREADGFEASDAALLRDRPWVLVPGGDGEAATRVEAVVAACGARVVPMSASAHDRAVAAISHLPLVVSAALVEAVAGRPGAVRDGWPAAAPIAAGGWASMTRLARGDVEMGTGIAATNATAVAEALRDLLVVLDGWLGDLERTGGPDDAAIRARFAAARTTLLDEGSA